MSESARIVVGVDGSEASQHALEWAVAEAARRGATLEVLHAWRQPKVFVPRAYRAGLVAMGRMEEAALELIDTQVDAIDPAASRPPTVECHEKNQFAGRALIEASRRAQLVVVGRQGETGYAYELVAPKVLQIAQHAKCPLVVVPSAFGERASLARGIVVGVDGSKPAAAALRWAHAEAALRDEPLIAVLAWRRLRQTNVEPSIPYHADYSDADAAAALDTIITGTLPDASLDEIKRITVHDLPESALVDVAAAASVLVVGSRGRGGFRGLLLGSVSHRCIGHSRCPTVVVR